MAQVNVEKPEMDLQSPTLIEGLPGLGLVGKLVVDHLVDTFEMEYYAGVYCDGIPSVAAYRTNDSELRPPVQLYADPERDLLALTSDVPVSPSEAPEFAACVTEWFKNEAVAPVYISGLAGTVSQDTDARSRELYGLSTGDGDVLLDRAGIVPPLHAGFVSGPTGALLHEAGRVGLDSVGLVIESTAEFPDLDAAGIVLDRGIEPITELDAEPKRLVDDAAEVPQAIEKFAEEMQEASDESTRAQPSPMFQ